MSVGRSVGRSEAIFCPAYFLQTTGLNFNKILYEASIPRGDVHTLKVLQLHVILQSNSPFTSASLSVSPT